MARIQAGFTQEELAEILDVSCMTIYRWESGQRTPDQEKRMQICTILGKKAEELGWSEGEEKLTIARGTRLLDPLIP